MAATKKSKTVKMYGTGNFYVEGDLYVFRDSEEVTATKVSHVPILEAESKRRRLNAERCAAITSKMSA